MFTETALASPTRPHVHCSAQTRFRHYDAASASASKAEGGQEPTRLLAGTVWFPPFLRPRNWLEPENDRAGFDMFATPGNLGGGGDMPWNCPSVAIPIRLRWAGGGPVRKV